METSVGYRLRRAQLAAFESIISMLTEIGLRPGSFSVLVLIGRNPGLKQSEISAALGIQRTNFVGLVDALEGRGLVVRKPLANDRRSRSLYLTGAGRKLAARAEVLQRKHEAALARRLGEGGRESLLKLLGRLSDADPGADG